MSAAQAPAAVETEALPPMRTVSLKANQGGSIGDFKDNYVSTTKYTPLTFLPMALFEQYRRVANQYFTVQAILSLTPISPVQPFSTWTPLLFVLGVSMLKEFLEDRARLRQDREQNARPCRVARGGEWSEAQWRDVRVGDVLIVEKDEAFPCDIVMLASSGDEGGCYVETMNLDGETNLKPKKAQELPDGFLERSANASPAAFEGVRIECETPNASLYTFRGNIHFDNHGARDENGEPVAPSAVLLRGSSLRNTDWVVGGAIFTGHDTKVMQNSVEAPAKRSTIERNLDYVVGVMFALLVTLATITGIVTGVWTKERLPDMWYLMPEDAPTQFDPTNAPAVGFFGSITSLVLYGYLIPISLYVSIEMVKVGQAFWFINRDAQMYDKETDTWARARTSNLNEELGQVANILSDKTGTLTQNRMEFKQVSIAGQDFGDPNGRTTRPHRAYNFLDPRIEGGAWRELENPTTRECAELLFLNLALCSTCVPSADEIHGVSYEAESPDEEALVVAAKQLGWTLVSRSTRELCLRVADATGAESEVKYELLHVIEFNSTRKRMSVIVRSPEGKLMLLTKGADSVIYERLATDSAHRGSTQTRLDAYAAAGLRTLCIAWAPLDEDRYAEWDAEYSAAKRSLSEDRDAVLEGLAEAIEKDLHLVGATAIEDRLQERVPDVIANLQAAGIRIWMLTGDKLETARNIGMSCKLLTSEMRIFTVEATELMEVAIEADESKTGGVHSADLMYGDRALRRAVREQMEEALGAVSRERAQAGPHALIIEGKALVHALDASLSDLFLQLAEECVAVVACRVSPLQKAQITRLVSVGDSAGLIPKRICLGIGDGANDVGMIREAHIGVGIAGQEGAQAVLASDFAISQFQFLERLLLVHGRWNYKRIARMISYFFFKNITIGIVLFGLSYASFFSTQPFVEDFTLMLYNVFFTSLPVIVCGVLDQDVSERAALRFPQLYQAGVRNEYFNARVLATWVANALYVGVVCSCLTLYVHSSTTADLPNGTTPDIWSVGFTLYSTVVWTVNLSLGMIIYNWTWLHHLTIWGSIAVLYLYSLAYSSFSVGISQGMHMLIFREGTAAAYWLSVLLVPPVALLAQFVYRVCQRTFAPLPHHIVQEIMQEDHSLDTSLQAATRGAAPAGGSRGASKEIQMLNLA